MQLAGGPPQAANSGIRTNKVFLPQRGREASERTFPIDTVLRRFDGARAGVAAAADGLFERLLAIGLRTHGMRLLEIRVPSLSLVVYVCVGRLYHYSTHSKS